MFIMFSRPCFGRHTFFGLSASRNEILPESTGLAQIVPDFSKNSPETSGNQAAGWETPEIHRKSFQ
jgi:hypothetical protein